MLKNPQTVFVVVVTVIATLAAVLFLLNFNAGEKKITQELPHLYTASDPQFERAMGSLLGPNILEGNQVTALTNGDQIFPAMLTAIKLAEKTITFETYIYWSGAIGQQFADALVERAKAGVKVLVLLDWVGSAKIDAGYLKAMETAGVKVHKFHKPVWYNLARLNNRTHRKLLVVDGRVGFTGGVGIAPQWTGNGQDADHWRDSHFRAEGPVVAQIQATFLNNWLKVTGEVQHGEEFFPAIKALGTERAQMFSSSPSNGSENMQLMYHLAINAAAQSIDLSMAYFVPDEMSRDLMIKAVKRGVRVRLITPGPITDTQTVRVASRRTWGPLLAAGVEIFEYQPSMYHCKIMIIDGVMTSVGSTNFDNRSLRLNDEANLNVYGREFAALQTAVFEKDLLVSRRMTFEQWQNRPVTEKLGEQMAQLLQSQL